MCRFPTKTCGSHEAHVWLMQMLPRKPSLRLGAVFSEAPCIQWPPQFSSIFTFPLHPQPQSQPCGFPLAPQLASILCPSYEDASLSCVQWEACCCHQPVKETPSSNWPIQKARLKKGTGSCKENARRPRTPQHHLLRPSYPNINVDGPGPVH